MSRDNKAIVKEINEPSHPEMGARPLPKKDVNTALEFVEVLPAKENVGAARKALDVQLGKHRDGMCQES
jgi:hypothetical protein